MKKFLVHYDGMFDTASIISADDALEAAETFMRWAQRDGSLEELDVLRVYEFKQAYEVHAGKWELTEVKT